MSGHPEFGSNITRSVIGQERTFPVPSSTDWDGTIEKVSKEKSRVNPLVKILRKPAVRNAAIAIPLIGLAMFGAKQFIDQQNANQHKIETSSTFDNNAKDQYINPNNSTWMTLDEYEKTGVQLWDLENKTLTIPLPIIFKDNRIPTLHVKKGNDPQIRSSTLPSFYVIDDGLQEGDIVCSPFDGEIRIGFYEIETSGYLRDFTFIPGDGSAKQGTYVIRTTPPSRPLFDAKDAIRLGENVDNFSIHVKKGDPILEILATIDGKSYNPQFSMLGNSSVEGDEVLNLATSGKDVILLKK